MASLYSIHGFVRNQPDGDVYIEAEAEENLLEKFVRWCHVGPENAEVRHVLIQEGELVNYGIFEIRR
jgi:acylphosphatase